MASKERMGRQVISPSSTSMVVLFHANMNDLSAVMSREGIEIVSWVTILQLCPRSAVHARVEQMFRRSVSRVSAKIHSNTALKAQLFRSFLSRQKVGTCGSRKRLESALVQLW
jgi:hypothetical protein